MNFVNQWRDDAMLFDIARDVVYTFFSWDYV